MGLLPRLSDYDSRERTEESTNKAHAIDYLKKKKKIILRLIAIVSFGGYNLINASFTEVSSLLKVNKK